MSTQRQRLLELALRGLESERERIENEIQAIQRELKRGRGGASVLMTDSGLTRRRKPKFSAVERRRRSERMRQYWAARRAARTRMQKAGAASATGFRRKPKFSAAERQRRAERMRQYWARRRRARKK